MFSGFQLFYNRAIFKEYYGNVCMNHSLGEPAFLKHEFLICKTFISPYKINKVKNSLNH
jgi:hypothetical protein